MQEAVKSPTVLQQVKACCRALEDKKAENVKVLYLGEKSSITDYFIIATGNSHPHLKAMRASIEEALDNLHIDIFGIDAKPSSGWLVVDAYDFMVHLFISEMRDYYRLESLWKDAEDVSLR